MKPKALILSLFLLPLIWTSCKKDDPVIVEEEELITTLVYSLTPDGGGETTTFRFQDLDGEGVGLPVVTVGDLKANTTYEGSISLSNELESPAEDITPEVQEESLDHQFFFTSSVPGLSISYNDKDTNDNPLGLKTLLSTGDAGQGTISIILKHLPKKTAAGVADGDITNAGGESDIEVSFDINVE